MNASAKGIKRNSIVIAIQWGLFLSLSLVTFPHMVEMFDENFGWGIGVLDPYEGSFWFVVFVFNLTVQYFAIKDARNHALNGKIGLGYAFFLGLVSSAVFGLVIGLTSFVSDIYYSTDNYMLSLYFEDSVELYLTHFFPGFLTSFIWGLILKSEKEDQEKDDKVEEIITFGMIGQGLILFNILVTYLSGYWYLLTCILAVMGFISSTLAILSSILGVLFNFDQKDETASVINDSSELVDSDTV